MPAITRETGVVLRFLASFRRIPLTIIRDQVESDRVVQDQVRTLRAIACDPYVAGSDIIGEEINDIRDLQPLIRELVAIAGANPGFVIRIHAGENDSLKSNVAESLHCVKESLAPGQAMPPLRIGHGLYTTPLSSRAGRQLMQELREAGAVLEFQLTSNVRLNNLSILRRHPLKQYLANGISCVQGTDGGALYGTDSIDEELALERMLHLSHGDMLAMRQAEDRVLAASLDTFARKQAAFAGLCGQQAAPEALAGSKSPQAAPETPALLYDPQAVEAFLDERIRREPVPDETLMIGRGSLESAKCLSGLVREMPTDKVPVILLGGSFNTDRRPTRMQDWAVEMLRRIVEEADPDRVFFVIGYRMLAYERELVRLCRGRFEIFAMVPTRLTEQEAGRLLKSGAGIRISIEPVGLGLYKSYAYEIFNRRSSVVVALDGNSAGTNVIQAARNGKHKAGIFINRHATSLYSKALTLRGYAVIFDSVDAADMVLFAAERVWEKMQGEQN
jgi:hypothetical protein